MPQTPNLQRRSLRSVRTPVNWGSRIFLSCLGLVACLYAAILVYHVTKPPETVVDHDDILERCRQICLKDGLLTTGHARNDAQAYLDVAQKEKLTDALSTILVDHEFMPVESESFELLNKTAPDFSLLNHEKNDVTLGQIGKDRPVVVVFYLGYGCSHCVTQLLALDKDLHHFRELDAEIVAISSDSPEHTSEKYLEYGEFHFQVPADMDYAVSQRWGVFLPETDETPEFMNHGTFIVDRNGKLIRGEQGPEPFLDNKTLLHVIAGSQGLMPAPAVTQSELQDVTQ